MPCHPSVEPSPCATAVFGIVATLVAFPIALALTFVVAWLNGWESIFKEDMAEWAIIAYRYLATVSPYILFMILGYGLTVWTMSEKASTGSSKKHVAKETELNLPPSPRQGAPSRKHVAKVAERSSKKYVAKETELNLPPSPRQEAPSRKHVAKVTELSPPPSPRQQTQSDASGSPLVESYEADWATLEFPKLTPPIFNIEDRGTEQGREKALTMLKHRKALAKHLQPSEESTEDEVWSADWSKMEAASAA